MLPITALLTGVLSVVLVALSALVSVGRFRTGASAGDGGDEGLRRRIRAQANFIEYVPMGLLALALVEYRLASTLTVMGLGMALVLGRLLHAGGMLGGSRALRAIGMVLTFASLLGSGCYLIFGPVGT
ncbi:MAG: MAPEG family protein [Caulobacteraceae bacterium]